MTTLIVKFEWDDELLGAKWLNKDNLKLCLFTAMHTDRGLLTVEVVPELEKPIPHSHTSEIDGVQP